MGGRWVGEREGEITKMRIIHVSTVSSDSGSNENRPIVISCECKAGGGVEGIIEAGKVSFGTHVSRK